MKRVALSALVVVLAVPGLGQEPARAITGVTLIDVRAGRRIPDRTVVVIGTRVTAVESAPGFRVPAGATVIDGTGKFLIPGLIDTHVHLATGAESDSPRRVDALVANGITGVRDAGASGRDQRLIALKAAAERGDRVSPRIYVSGMVSNRSVARYGSRDARTLARQLLAWGVDGLKIRDGLTLDDVKAVMAEAASRGVPVFGHTFDANNRTQDEVYTFEAVDAGVSGVMHISGNAQVRVDNRPEPPQSTRFGPDTWQDWWLHYTKFWLRSDTTLEQRLIDAMIKRRVWLEPTLITEDWIANPQFYRDAWGVRGLPGTFEQASSGWPVYSGASLGEFRAAFDRMKAFVRRFHLAGGVVVSGTDCVLGCGHGLADELRLLVEAGLSPAAALRAATLDAATTLGWGDRLGRVEQGATADLLLLDDDPLQDIRNVTRVRALFINGRYLDRTNLDAVRAGR